jgi:pimeloyl-ACP methyl ester carboxylesterase
MSAGDLPSEERIAALSSIVYHPSTSPDLIAEDTAVRLANPTTEAGYGGQLAASLLWDGLSRLGEISCPTLVLHGRQDRLVGLACGQVLAERIPGARLVALDDCGHQLFTDQLEAGSQAVLEHLSGRG